MSLISKVKEFLDERQTGKGVSLLCALSGGRDSVALLNALHTLREEYGYQLKAVHVEHGIRETSLRDAEFCRNLCDAMGVELYLYHGKAAAMAEEEGLSLEDAARRLRYARFEDAVRQEINVFGAADIYVVLAHHEPDHAETVLLHLLRGSGLRGLCGMRPVRGQYWRPMLNVSKAEIDAYMQENSLEHVEDETNEDTAYTRNRIRHELIPMLENGYNPEIVHSLARMASLLTDDEDFLAEMTAAVGLNASRETFDLRGFESLPMSLKRRKLRAWLAENGGLEDLEEGHIESLMDLAQGKTGRSVCLPRGLTVTKSYDILFFNFFSDGAEDTVPYLCEEMSVNDLSQRGMIPDLPEEKWMDADKIHGKIEWRTRKEGDYIEILRGEEGNKTLGRQKLQDFFINRKVPREQRKSLKMLADGSHILWVPGYRMSDGVRIGPATVRVLHVYRKGDNHA